MKLNIMPSVHALALHVGSARLGPEGLHPGVAHKELDEVAGADDREIAALHENRARVNLVPVNVGHEI